eukprot:jgi/Bigna1/71577/fgenesh1_pg.16_\
MTNRQCENASVIIIHPHHLGIHLWIVTSSARRLFAAAPMDVIALAEGQEAIAVPTHEGGRKCCTGKRGAARNARQKKQEISARHPRNSLRIRTESKSARSPLGSGSRLGSQMLLNPSKTRHKRAWIIAQKTPGRPVRRAVTNCGTTHYFQLLLFSLGLGYLSHEKTASHPLPGAASPTNGRFSTVNSTQQLALKHRSRSRST